MTDDNKQDNNQVTTRATRSDVTVYLAEESPTEDIKDKNTRTYVFVHNWCQLRHEVLVATRAMNEQQKVKIAFQLLRRASLGVSSNTLVVSNTIFRRTFEAVSSVSVTCWRIRSNDNRLPIYCLTSRRR
ncbi:unnamed protein product [Ceratitis capitata]|uniref:(Mediterranean fruit fly) hypothetical protein n=1 Tax=Ceratitis capitata TaxID=7213 RepID=A0A811USW0_CERCA|nr:unnamed protein product [Ceratitis capitata]